MTTKETVLNREFQRGRAAALELQKNAGNLDGTQLNDADDRIPRFAAAAANCNMLRRPVGFVCKSSAGRVARLLQNYDSDIYPAEPEELSAQWGFVWSQDPGKALPFAAIATSPYNKGDCCAEDGRIYRSKIDGNVHAPSAYPAGWEVAAV